ncbi:MAG: NAD(P)-dependent oxidoreductase [Phycisphaerales bacterium]|jgi:nucleoside-diphosphate-sugar epimerase|nr:NAD(P)-dependent oxidoreductase [Phycisphaerales bacterium]
MIALTGATGFIGAAVARRFASDGIPVRALARASSNRGHVQDVVTEFVTGDLADRDWHETLLDGADTLIHNGVDWKLARGGDLPRHLDVNIAASIELLDLAARRGMRVVFVSSVAVHHHMLPEWNGQIDSMHPTRPGNLYGASKAAIEAHLWSLRASHDLRFTIIRPAAVYGIDPTLMRSIGAPIIEQVRKGEAFTRSGGGKFVHVDDVAESMCAGAAAADCGVYHLADCYARWCDWATCVCEIEGVDVDIDRSSPTKPANMFTTDALSADLGVTLERGMDGIRTHLRALSDLLPRD